MINVKTKIKTHLTAVIEEENNKITLLRRIKITFYTVHLTNIEVILSANIHFFMSKIFKTYTTIYTRKANTISTFFRSIYNVNVNY